MFADTFLIEKVRLGLSCLLICAMAGEVTLAAENTYNCIPMKGGASSISSMYLDQFHSNQLMVSPPTAAAVNAPSAADNFYIVQKGDTLYAIMRKSGVPIENLIVLNQLPSSHELKVGQTLKLPELANTALPRKPPEISSTQSWLLPREVTSTATSSSSEAVDRYVVRVGDTLYAISRQTGVSIERLVSLNQLTASNSINAGQQLRLR
ncbi:LysM repeat-containing protein [Thiothrix caldifontis]|uniref:LysM repeat-containing protein n=1 Tax=Thiothrix caldifontis TaxID=525918 RepID=A0A1H4AWW1_9GAMM|nr:LysM peptidoglycan-binding domain-containing protein [Thiothrix caldifontis]SEA40142.1 LysM repeat-containing protein [Thiothrix caldifontis]